MIEKLNIVIFNKAVSICCVCICVMLNLPSFITISKFPFQYRERLVLTFSLSIMLLLSCCLNRKEIITFSKIDGIFLGLCLYMMLNTHSLLIENYCNIISLIGIYILFRNISLKCMWTCLLITVFLCLLQLLYSYHSFSYPWESLSDITGVFHNTGI